MAIRVCTWNLFHGRSRPAFHGDLVDEFAGALGAHDWDVCGLQEAPPWWTVELASALGASARSVRTSLWRGALPALQECIHRRDPEILGVRGAGANMIFVRPQAGEIVDHRVATLRWLPQRRTVHAVRLRRPSGAHWWVANVHTHNKPESAAAADTIRALGLVAGWAGSEPAVLLGDLNLAAPQGLARVEGWDHLYGHRVDHVLGLATGGVRLHPGGDAFAELVRRASGEELSDHRIVGLRVTAR